MAESSKYLFYVAVLFRPLKAAGLSVSVTTVIAYA